MRAASFTIGTKENMLLKLLNGKMELAPREKLENAGVEWRALLLFLDSHLRGHSIPMFEKKKEQDRAKWKYARYESEISRLEREVKELNERLESQVKLTQSWCNKALRADKSLGI